MKRTWRERMDRLICKLAGVHDPQRSYRPPYGQRVALHCYECGTDEAPGEVKP